MKLALLVWIINSFSLTAPQLDYSQLAYDVPTEQAISYDLAEISDEAFLFEPFHGDEDDKDEINIYPNPVNHYFQLQNPGNVASIIQIYDILGRKALEFSVEGEDRFDVSSLQNGRYFARIFDKEGQTLKVIRLIKS